MKIKKVKILTAKKRRAKSKLNLKKYTMRIKKSNLKKLMIIKAALKEIQYIRIANIWITINISITTQKTLIRMKLN